MGRFVNSTPSLAAVVILVPQHLRFLNRLVLNLNQAAPSFEEVIVVASGFSLRQRHVVRKTLSFLQAECTVLFPKLGSAGQNRNLGARKASTDLVSFLDADDLYAPDRNQIIKTTFLNTKFDIFLHSFVPFYEESELAGKLDQATTRGSILVDEKDLLVSTFPEGRRDRERELSGKSPSTNLISALLHPRFPTHHAHVTASRDVLQKIQFHEIFGMRNEDGIFARDVLHSGGHVVVSSLTLSGYQQGARAKPRPNLALLARAKGALQRVFR